MVKIVGIYTQKLIDENNRPKIPKDFDVSKLSQAQQNRLYQNRLSIQEFEAWKNPIHITTEHGDRRDIGYVTKMWVDEDGNPFIEAEIEDAKVGVEVLQGRYKGLSMKGSREVLNDGSVGCMDIEEISLVREPFFPECKITYCGSNKMSKKYIYMQNKEVKKNNRILFTISSQKMSEKKEEKKEQVESTSAQDDEGFRISKEEHERFKYLIEKNKRETEEYERQGESEFKQDFGVHLKELESSGNLPLVKKIYTNPEAKSMKEFWKKLVTAKNKEREKREEVGEIENPSALRGTSKKRKMITRPNTFNKNNNTALIKTKASRVRADLICALMAGTPLDKTNYDKYN